METDYGKIKRKLEERREVLKMRLRVRKKGVKAYKPTNPDRADLAQSYFMRERNLVLHGRVEDALEKVENALQRMDEGSYGKCARCGKDIPLARLQALPYVKYCFDCQKRVERIGKR